MKKNCENCKHLEWGFGDVGDPEGWCCLKRDYYKYGNYEKAESKHLKQLENDLYRKRPKKCCELEQILEG